MIETLAALAIASVIILSTGALIHQSVFFFDRGTRTVDKGEELVLAIDSLTRDFGAARFIVQKSGSDLSAAFLGSRASEDTSAKVIFVTAGGKSEGPPVEEVVNLTVETGDGFTQLVRRRAIWSGPRMLLTDAQTSDAVILLKGKYDISFSFAEEMGDGTLAWRDEWAAKKSLPRSVRLNVRDGPSGATLLAGAEFSVEADASAACGAGEIVCLASATAKVNPGAPASANQARN